MSKDGEAVALVLRRLDSGESDRRITILTEDLGKIDLYAKGARKGGSRLASSTEPLIVARFSWAEGRARRFITSVEPRTSFPGLRSDYDRLACGLAWVEILAASLSEDIASSEVFKLALATVQWIETKENAIAALCYGLSLLLSFEGHQPDWSHCIETGEGITTNPVYVSPHAGGYVSAQVSERYTDRLEISAEALIALSKLTELPEPPKAIRDQVDVLCTLINFWMAITDRPLPACRSLYESVKGGLG